MRLLNSFKVAFRGIMFCIIHERNMRFHTVAAVYVVLFSLFFNFSSTQYAILFLLFGVMMSLEIINTGLEELADRITSAYHPHVKAIKDVAAGAVLIMAIFSVAIACALFWQTEGFVRFYELFCLQKPWLWAVVLPVTTLCYWYVAKGPHGIRNIFLKRKSEKE